MILPTMSPKEIFDAIEMDSKKLVYRRDKIYPKVVHQFKKARKFPTSYIDEYVIPSTNNKHITYYNARNINDVEHPGYMCFTEMFAGGDRYVLRASRMGYTHTPESKLVMLPTIQFYTSHFFQRYNERFLHRNDITTNEIAGVYFLRNANIMPIKINEDINRNFKEYDESNAGVKVPDGFCFVRRALQGVFCGEELSDKDKVDAMIMLYMTFMNDSAMSETQIEAIKKEFKEAINNNLSELLKSGHNLIGKIIK